MAIFASGTGKQATKLLEAPQCGGKRKIHVGAAAEQRLHRLKLAVQGCSADRSVRMRSTIAQQTQEWNLHATLPRYAAGRNQHQSFVESGLSRTGVENDSSYLEDVGGQFAATHRIFRDKLEQSWISKIIAAFKDHVLMDQPRVVF